MYLFYLLFFENFYNVKDDKYMYYLQCHLVNNLNMSDQVCELFTQRL